MYKEYFKEIHNLLNTLEEKQGNTLKLVAEKVAYSIENEGIIHLFGAGHSHLLTEEVFYRAGGLVPISPVLEESLMLHEGAVRSSTLERKRGYAEQFMDKVDIRSEDIVVVISTSGRNPVPIDAAKIAKRRGTYVVGITSVEYSLSQPSRHESGDHLLDAVDVVIDNLSKKGDALLTHEKMDIPFAPSSTVIGATILNSIFAEVISIIADKGKTPPVLLSGNIDGADGHNQKLIDKYKHRIPLLK